MRLFTGLNIDIEVRDKLQGLVEELKPLARLRWSPPENLHITTKFIGEWPENRIGELNERMPVGQPAPDVSVSGVGFFPNDQYPKVFFARVEPCPELTRLAHATDLALQELGVLPEKHAYRPHVTLARVPAEVRLHGMRERLQELQPAEFGKFWAAEFSLFESRGGKYTKLANFALQVASR